MKLKAPIQDRKKSTSVAAALSSSPTTRPSFGVINNRPEAIAQRKLAQMIEQSPRMVAQRAYLSSPTDKPVQCQRLEEEASSGASAPIQRAQQLDNHTGLPTHLKTGIENLSGLSMNQVKVHYNSSKPAQLQALAYTQGENVYVGPGQEKHLPHEAWHVVQQTQGRVKPTLQAKGVAINDDQGLEKEADVMGEKSSQGYSRQKIENAPMVQAMGRACCVSKSGAIQRVKVLDSATGHTIDTKNYSKKQVINLARAFYAQKNMDELKILQDAYPDYKITDFDLMVSDNQIKFSGRTGEKRKLVPKEEKNNAQASGVKLEGQSEEEFAKRTNKIYEWLISEKHDKSYAEPEVEKKQQQALVHKISKGKGKEASDLACWNWALMGLQDKGIRPDVFWTNVLDPKLEKNDPDWLKQFSESAQASIKNIMQKLAQSKLARNPWDEVKEADSKEQEKAAPIMKEMCETLIHANGMEVVAEEEATAIVACQYIKKEGAAVPEHWWIELPNGAVIQTVPGCPLEVGDQSTKWHSSNGRLAESASDYNEIRIPIKVLKEDHLNILIKAMDKKTPKKRFKK